MVVCTDVVTGFGIPEANCSVSRSRSDRAAFVQPGHGENPFAVVKRVQVASALRVPDGCLGVLRTRQDVLAVG